MATKKELDKELAKLKAAIAAAEEEDEPDEDEPDEEADPEEQAADVARKSAKAAKGKEIAGASEATMQAFLDETRKVRALLEGGKISGPKAGKLFSGLFDIFGGDED